jgi:hypothetical protein
VGTKLRLPHCLPERPSEPQARPMNSIIYLVGLIVIVMAILSLVGLH